MIRDAGPNPRPSRTHWKVSGLT